MPAADLKNMDVDALLALRADVESLLAERADDLQRQIALLGGSPNKRPSQPTGGAVRAKHTKRLEGSTRSTAGRQEAPAGMGWRSRGGRRCSARVIRLKSFLSGLGAAKWRPEPVKEARREEGPEDA